MRDNILLPWFDSDRHVADAYNNKSKRTYPLAPPSVTTRPRRKHPSAPDFRPWHRHPHPGRRAMKGAALQNLQRTKAVLRMSDSMMTSSPRREEYSRDSAISPLILIIRITWTLLPIKLPTTTLRTLLILAYIFRVENGTKAMQVPSWVPWRRRFPWQRRSWCNELLLESCWSGILKAFWFFLPISRGVGFYICWFVCLLSRIYDFSLQRLMIISLPSPNSFF